MAEDYRPMWKELGLDLDTHDALLKAVGEMYGAAFLSQKNRPAGMAYLDFVMSEVHGLRIKELMDAKKQGRKVIGSYCVYVPEELVLAVDGVSVGLCAGAEFAFDQAEKYLPRTTCSLIKAAFGFKLARVCPYVEASDIIVGENTCDGKKKAYEIMKGIIPSFYVIDLPQMKSETGRGLLRAEYAALAKKLEEISGKKITANSLKNGIAIVNAKRKAVNRVMALRSADPAPISGLDALLINQVFFYDDPVRFTESVNKIADELEERVKKKQGAVPAGTPRVLVSGCPMAVPNWKVPGIVETSGAVIVGEELCTGERGHHQLTEESGKTVDEMIDRITNRYFDIHCAVFTPNPTRLGRIREMSEQYNAQGVIDYTLQYCQPYQIEGGVIADELKKNGTPVLRIDTDYSAGDTEQIRTRVQAFLEQIKK
ncbi:MAG TPA: double-cubane-cluster-containing anaerobic reductase [Spirochaetota bacterium]|nr:2-hydroxyacyl-CoA dehydratase [Spirochaetota bacterium]HOD13155.1 double-cubane-cluster-containing anaerobic reductase [Spirochaetota bacterium]HPG49038.1 double-cubane-cluster-containing anaerobic reductase [Spirochaetota bacterium]HPN10506.1 double-cubane-cluster-containing anaerobic reductase [Spirochaetota bacterium]